MRRGFAPALLLALALPAVGRAEALAGAAGDRAVILPPPGAVVLPYANYGYRLELAGDGGVRVEVAVDPIGSGVLLGPLPDPSRGPVERVAAWVASGALTRYDAVSRVLGWVSREIRYELDRGLPQDPAAVLARRSAHCTGIARLTVALLGALAIEAREVAGFVAAEPAGGEYHRWVEVFFPDRGWIFSDPMRYHHYVPATYVPFASELVVPEGAASGLLLARERRDPGPGRNPWARETVRARGNGRRAGAAPDTVAEGREREGCDAAPRVSDRGADATNWCGRGR